MNIKTSSVSKDPKAISEKYSKKVFIYGVCLREREVLFPISHYIMESRIVFLSQSIKHVRDGGDSVVIAYKEIPKMVMHLLQIGAGCPITDSGIDFSVELETSA